MCKVDMSGRKLNTDGVSSYRAIVLSIYLSVLTHLTPSFTYWLINTENIIFNIMGAINSE